MSENLGLDVFYNDSIPDGQIWVSKKTYEILKDSLPALVRELNND